MAIMFVLDLELFMLNGANNWTQINVRLAYHIIWRYLQVSLVCMLKYKINNINYDKALYLIAGENELEAQRRQQVHEETGNICKV